VPSKKDNGFLSIEKAGNKLSYLVYRNFLGATHFSGVISASVARVKEIVKADKFKVKVAVASKV